MQPQFTLKILMG